MNCQRVRDRIKAYIDGELGMIERWRIARHLDTCAACRKERIAMEDLTKKLSESEHKSAPERLRGRVMAKIELEGAKDSPRRSWTARSYAQLAVLALIVVVLAAIVPPIFTTSIARESRRVAQYNARQIGLPIELKAKPLRDQAPASEAPVPAVAHKSQEVGAGGMPLLIIKTAEITIEVRRFQPAYDRAIVIAGSVGGYVTNSSSQTNDASGAYGTVTMRVPVDSFDRTLDRLGQLGKVRSRTVTGEDVTGQVVDIESRLRNKRAEERQYLEIMNRVSRIADIVTVTNELSRVRGEIEEAEGRLKYLKSAAAMSTINVEISEKGAKKSPAVPSLGKTFSDAGHSLLGTLKAVARTMIWLLVYVPLWGIPIVLWIVFRKRAAVK